MLKLRPYKICWLLIFTPIAKVSAQLTVFNVSSSTITDKRKVSVQQQFEIQDEIESSTTVTYGLGKKWEMGLNLINLDYNMKERSIETNDSTTVTPFAPLLLANAQKVFELNKVLSIGLGTVAGTNLTSSHARKFVYYSYTNLLVSAGNQDQYQFAAGPYLSNHRYLGQGSYYGFQCAMDAGIFYKKLHILADWISGYSQKGKLSLGIEVFLTQRLPLSLGWQRSNQDGSQGAVIQLTFVPQ